MQIEFAWYDIWVGFYWDRSARVLYFCPIPTVLVSIPFKETTDE